MTSRTQQGPAGGVLGHLPAQNMVAKVSYAPSVQTTVVTTTTTTTTSFPPFVMQAPRNLYERDPELYPLAAIPTPDSLKKIRVQLNGQTAVFEEADDSHQALQEYKQLHTALQHANSGTVRTVTSSSNDVPGTASNRCPPQLSSPLQYDPSATLRKRPAVPAFSPPPTDGLDQIHRNKRHRTIPARLSIPESHVRSDTTRDSISRGLNSENLPPHSFLSDLHPRRNILDGAQQQIAGSATPPSLESDADPFNTTLTHSEHQPVLSLPSFAEGSPFQDASLPSPSLSPITAAAQLSRTSALSKLRGQHGLSRPISPTAGPSTGSLVDEQLETHMQIDDSLDTEENTDEPHIHKPSFTDIPSIIDSFDTLPESLKSYVMHQLLRRCSKPTLLFLSEVIAPALKCDFFARLPLELSLNVLKYLDGQSLCRAAQVSKRWRSTVDGDETVWKNLLDADGFRVQDGEIQRAIEEGWGWQIPSADGRDINFGGSSSFSENASSPSALGEATDDTTSHSGQRRKRKTNGRGSVHKKQRRKSSTMSTLTPSGLSILNPTHGPYAYAQVAMKAVRNPNIGLPSLDNFHLFKSIYRRHHQVRQAWMSPNTKPKHLAFRAHQRHVVTCLQFDSEKIITGSDDSNIDIYDTQTGATIRSLRGHEGGVWALENEGDMLVSGSTDRSVRIWRISDGECLHTFQGHTSTVRCLQILRPVKIGQRPDGKPIMMPKVPMIITGSRDSTCRVWKLPNFDDDILDDHAAHATDTDNPYFVRALTGHTHSVRAIAAYGDTLVSGSYDASVRVWKISTGDLVHRLLGHSSKVYSVVLDYDRSRCISGSMDNLVKVWSLETGNLLFNLEGHNSLVGLLDLRDNYLVSAAADSTLRVWDPQNGRCDHVLSAHTGAITCFSHDGQKIISGSDRTLKMWNTRTGECVRDLLTDLSGVWQIRFDERRCIAAVQRNDWTYIEVLDFGASRDGVPKHDLGRRIVVNDRGQEVEEEDWLIPQDGADGVQA